MKNFVYRKGMVTVVITLFISLALLPAVNSNCLNEKSNIITNHSYITNFVKDLEMTLTTDKKNYIKHVADFGGFQEY